MKRAPLKYAAKEFSSVVAAVMCLLIVSVITAFTNAGLDPNKLVSIENVTTMCMTAVTTIFGIVVAIPLGIVYTKQLTTDNGAPGKYLKTVSDYNAARTNIDKKRLMFGQWHSLRHLKEQHDKCVNYLLEHNIEQAEDILKLSREQILKLTTSQMFEIDGIEVYFKALTHAQIRACNNVLSGRIVVRKLPDFYFLYIDGKSDKSFYDQASSESRDNTMFLVSRLSYRIFIGFVITSIFTSLVISKMSEDVGTAEYILKALIIVFAKLFNAISSVHWGFQIGQEQVYRQCYYISGKTQFLELFDKDVDFVARDLQEIAKEDYEAQKGVVTEYVDNQV